MKEPIVSRILQYILYVVLVAGILFTVTLPFMLDRYMFIIYDAYSLQPGYRLFITIFIIMVAIPSLWIALEMIWMLRSIPKEPFVMRNVYALYRIGVLFLLLSAAFFGKCLLFVTVLTFLCGILFIGGGLFAFTLAALIRQAIVFREENELTI